MKLWNPTKEDRRALRTGEMKRYVRNLTEDQLIHEADCPFCGKRVYRYESRDKYLTLTGTTHTCKGMLAPNKHKAE